jgi:DNA-binding transcriptional ArsR family regulator
MEAALKAIAEPRRRAILRLVRDRELPAGEIADQFEVTRPAISQHLRVLKDAGLIVERREGTKRLYRAVPEAVEEIRAFLEQFWDENLDRLKFAAEFEAAKEKRHGRSR